MTWTPTHRHYKGGLYRVIGCAMHTESEKMLVIYDDAEGRLWARPEPMFNHPGRFTPIEAPGAHGQVGPSEADAERVSEASTQN
jgi:hypothetical protein